MQPSWFQWDLRDDAIACAPAKHAQIWSLAAVATDWAHTRTPAVYSQHPCLQPVEGGVQTQCERGASTQSQELIGGTERQRHEKGTQASREAQLEEEGWKQWKVNLQIFSREWSKQQLLLFDFNSLLAQKDRPCVLWRGIKICVDCLEAETLLWKELSFTVWVRGESDVTLQPSS